MHLSVEILREIRGLRGDVQTIRGFTAVRIELDRTHARLDNLVEISGDRWRALDARVLVLERRRRRPR